MPNRYRTLDAFFRGTHTKQTKFAKDVGCSDATIHLIRFGLRAPRLALALRIAEKARIPLESLLLPEPADEPEEARAS